MKLSQVQDRLHSAGHLVPDSEAFRAYHRMAKVQWLYGMGLPIPATHEEVAVVFGKLTAPLRARDVYAALKINGTTIPADMEGTFEVAIEGSAHDRAYTGKLIVRRATGAYAKHRIFVPCSCGAEVPFGRIAQHKCK